jgi:hypothetical protein
VGREAGGVGGESGMTESQLSSGSTPGWIDLPGLGQLEAAGIRITYIYMAMYRTCRDDVNTASRKVWRTHKRDK